MKRRIENFDLKQEQKEITRSINWYKKIKQDLEKDNIFLLEEIEKKNVIISELNLKILNINIKIQEEEDKYLLKKQELKNLNISIQEGEDKKNVNIKKYTEEEIKLKNNLCAIEYNIQVQKDKKEKDEKIINNNIVNLTIKQDTLLSKNNILNNNINALKKQELSIITWIEELKIKKTNIEKEIESIEDIFIDKKLKEKILDNELLWLWQIKKEKLAEIEVIEETRNKAEKELLKVKEELENSKLKNLSLLAKEKKIQELWPKIVQHYKDAWIILNI